MRSALSRGLGVLYARTVTWHGNGNIDVELEIPVDTMVYLEGVVWCAVEVLPQVVLG